MRATNIVRASFEAGLLVPDIGPIDQLGGASKQPSLAELKLVMGLQHLAACLEHKFFYADEGGDNGLSDWNRTFEARPPAEVFHFAEDQSARDGLLRKWRERFRRATYRLWLAGAALSRAYNEPFFLHPDYNSRDFSFGTGARPISREDWSHMGKFAVYNNIPDDVKEAAAFEPLAGWIVDTAKAEAIKRAFIPAMNRPGYPQYSDDEDQDSEPADGPEIFAVWELMTMLLAYEHNVTKFVKGPGIPNLAGKRQKLAPCRDGPTRKVRVVPFGVFQLEEITMPARVEDSAGMLLIANLVRPTWEQRPPDESLPHRVSYALPMAYSWDVANTLRLTPPAPDHDELTNRGPHWPLQFFTYALRVYFKKRISDRALDPTWYLAGYREWIRESDTFIERDDEWESYGMEVLAPYT